jgi:hypothetical protein
LTSDGVAHTTPPIAGAGKKKISALDHKQALFFQDLRGRDQGLFTSPRLLLQARGDVPSPRLRAMTRSTRYIK